MTLLNFDFYPKVIQWFKFNFAIILLVVFYTTEAINKYVELLTGNYIIFPRIIKLLVICYFFVAIITSKKKYFLIYVLLLIVIFLIGQLALQSSFNFNSILILGRYLYPLILFQYFFNYNFNDRNRALFFWVFEGLILINSFLIIIGFIFGVELFQTYDGTRFGYNGLLLTSSTSSYVYIISLFYILFLFNKKSGINWKMAVILFSCCFVGTKALYLALVVFLIYYFLTSSSSKIKYLLGGVLTIFAIGFTYLFLFEFGIINQVRNQESLLTALLSYRDKLLIEDTIPYIKENWTIWNVFFGGVSDFSTRSEMGFIDVFYFWGIFGGIMYLWTYYLAFFNFKMDIICTIFIILLIIIIFLAGNFFIYSTIPIYLVVIREKILCTHNDKLNEL